MSFLNRQFIRQFSSIMTTTVMEYGTPATIGPRIAECQRNAFLREFQSKIVSVQPWTLENADKRTGSKKKQKKSKKKKKQKKQAFFELELADTILFPDGGGQPTDYGTINQSIRVLQVHRTADGRILHKVDSTANLEIGSEVSIEVDWHRRYDHMQQHSAQHLISAVFRRELNMPTISWWMSQSPKSSLIEMRVPPPQTTAETAVVVVVDNDDTDNKLNEEQNANNDDNHNHNSDDGNDNNSRSALTARGLPNEIRRCEDIINDIIRDARAMNVRVFHDSASIDAFALAETKFTQKELPAGTGPLRVIEIPDLEFNTCCGTHVSNTAQLQAVVVTNFQYVEKERLLKLNFVAGTRVSTNFHAMYERERQLFKLLSCGEDALIANLTKLQSDGKNQRSMLRAAEKELTLLRVQKYIAKIATQTQLSSSPQNACLVFHENFSNASMSMIQQMSDAIVSSVVDTGHGSNAFVFVLFTIAQSESSHSGQFLMACTDVSFMKENKKALIQFIAKGGGGKPGRIQGKAHNLKNCSSLIEFVEQSRVHTAADNDNHHEEQKEENEAIAVKTESNNNNNNSRGNADGNAAEELDDVISKLLK